MVAIPVSGSGLDTYTRPWDRPKWRIGGASSPKGSVDALDRLSIGSSGVGCSTRRRCILEYTRCEQTYDETYRWMGTCDLQAQCRCDASRVMACLIRLESGLKSADAASPVAALKLS